VLDWFARWLVEWGDVVRVIVYVEWFVCYDLLCEFIYWLFMCLYDECGDWVWVLCVYYMCVVVFGCEFGVEFVVVMCEFYEVLFLGSVVEEEGGVFLVVFVGCSVECMCLIELWWVIECGCV